MADESSLHNDLEKIKVVAGLAEGVLKKLQDGIGLASEQIKELEQISSLSDEVKKNIVGGPEKTSEAERLTNEILEVILGLATLDFSKTVNVDYEDSNFNAVAAGLNMLGQELQRSVVSKEELEKVVVQLTRAEKQLQKAYENLEQLVQERTRELSMTNAALKVEVEERKKAEQEAMSREQKYRNIFEATSVSVWEQDVTEFFAAIDELKKQPESILVLSKKDPGLLNSLVSKLKIVDVNSATLKIFEADKKEDLIEGIGRIFTDKSRHTFGDMILDMISGRPLLSKETEFVTLKGRKITTLLQISFINGGGALAHIVDITAQKGLEQQLRQSQKMEAIGQLAGGVAHDFNNLLTVILSYGQLIIDDLLPEDPMVSKVSAIVECGERAAALTRQLLSFSRADVVTSKVLDLNIIVERIGKMLHRVLGEHVRLETKLAKNCGKIYADEGHIEQIIMNLSVNARDAMPQGGVLTIETNNFECVENSEGLVPGRYVRLIVSDNGQGMSDEVRAHIFEPFFTTKEVGKGTGLGLSTVYGIAKQNHAVIVVDSTIGVGTVFTVYFSRHDNDNVALDEHGEQIPVGANAGKETVLLVEDEKSVRQVSSMALKNKGYKVLEASNADEAIAIASNLSLHIDLLLSDVIMPGLTGPELANKLHTSGRNDLKVLFVSGYTDNALSKFEGLRQEVNFLSKPFLPAQLVKKVREIIDGTSEPPAS